MKADPGIFTIDIIMTVAIIFIVTMIIIIITIINISVTTIYNCIFATASRASPRLGGLMREPRPSGKKARLCVLVA